jgi:hypothetical protein
MKPRGEEHSTNHEIVESDCLKLHCPSKFQDKGQTGGVEQEAVAFRTTGQFWPRACNQRAADSKVEQELGYYVQLDRGSERGTREMRFPIQLVRYGGDESEYTNPGPIASTALSLTTPYTMGKARYERPKPSRSLLVEV